MMRRTIALAAAGAAALAAAGPAAGPAQARWGEAQLVSVDNARLEQADGATSAVDLSGDGRWVVFQTRAANFFADDDFDAPGTMRQGGVFRFDRLTGQLQLVADGDLLDEASGTLLRRGAARPSVSDDGRWVAFSTAQRLVPQDDNDNVDVYVRDMSVPLGPDRTAGAYRLVSALDGGERPAAYAPVDPPLPGRNPGADLFAAQAISADGRHVVFRTTDLASDLPAGGALDAPPGSVFVRDVQAQRTVLVTARSDGGGSAGGALAPVVISRDGSTVAWVGQHAPEQTRMLPGESDDDAQRYYLWRRWDEPGASTRRVTGLADPDDPACPPGGQVGNSPLATGPCYGPLSDVDSGFNDIGAAAPALSADGWTVAFLSGAAARPAQDVDAYLDAYVTSMRPGVTRKAGTRTVTRGTTASNPLVNGDVESVALSADASRIVIATARRQFLAPAPPLAGDPRSSAGGTELYEVGLGAGGATRRILRPGGSGDVAGAVDANPALSADGRTLAFVTRAANLVPGDANGLADAFVVTDADEAQGGAPPAGLGEDEVDEDLSSGGDEVRLRIVAGRDGQLTLRVAVPSAGALRAIARTRPAVAARRARGRRARAARPRQVAAASAKARRRGTTTLTLRLGRRDLAAVKRSGPLPVRVTVTLTPAGGGRRRTVAANARFAVRRAAARGRAR
jgi:WD40-like Beta Propeller Repeat